MSSQDAWHPLVNRSLCGYGARPMHAKNSFTSKDIQAAATNGSHFTVTWARQPCTHLTRFAYAAARDVSDSSESSPASARDVKYTTLDKILHA